MVHVGACRAQTTVGATASILAGCAVALFIRWMKIEGGIGGRDRHENELIASSLTGEQMRNFFDVVEVKVA